ncbi:MAG: hypothetical protein ACI3X1_04640, partial [Eubacteriales bacterium]
ESSDTEESSETEESSITEMPSETEESSITEVSSETEKSSDTEEFSDIETQHEEPDTSDSVDIIKGGCGSVIGSGSAVLIATICCGAVILLKRKKIE